MGSKFDIAARKAAAQHGRVGWWQLVEEGVDRHEIQRWLETGRLHGVHHGVYAVGHRGRTTESDYMAAVLACGKGAVLSYRAAAHLLRLLRGAPPRPEVTVPTTAGRARPGIKIHPVS
jgi:predicted transcriptional regulator of viral defense system